jgi:hypothetical protein
MKTFEVNEKRFNLLLKLLKDMEYQFNKDDIQFVEYRIRELKNKRCEPDLTEFILAAVLLGESIVRNYPNTRCDNLMINNQHVLNLSYERNEFSKSLQPGTIINRILNGEPKNIFDMIEEPYTAV